jgi:hypothetical protein
MMFREMCQEKQIMTLFLRKYCQVKAPSLGIPYSDTSSAQPVLAPSIADRQRIHASSIPAAEPSLEVGALDALGVRAILEPRGCGQLRSPRLIPVEDAAGCAVSTSCAPGADPAQLLRSPGHDDVLSRHHTLAVLDTIDCCLQYNVMLPPAPFRSHVAGRHTNRVVSPPYVYQIVMSG